MAGETGNGTMGAPSWMGGPPKKILLATDLSPRGDRALDRAVALAVQWQADLVVLHVLEEFQPDSLGAAQLPSWRRPPDPVGLARKQLLADTGAVPGKVTVLVGEGDVVDSIMRTAGSEQCGLIVLGTARNELLGRVLLGRTVDRLLRRSAVPLLVVKDRPRGPYRHIAVAVDFSDSSRHALEAAARFFPDQRLTIFHAYDPPMSSFLQAPVPYSQEYRKVAARECEAFLEKVDKPASWRMPQILIEDGPPTVLLRDYVREKGVDLVVLGTHGRSAVLEIFIGSMAKAIMYETPCDALVIREPRAAVET
ncbi:MAG: universal stress protein [Rhodospirillaceae bacterium]|nr:universal stress protein [Rhodospirillaceae bacterium]